MMKTVLFICTGNTCRSPMAEKIFNRLAAGLLPGYRAQSCGLSASEGSPASTGARLAAQDAGLDLSEHRSRRVTSALLRDADVIVPVSASHALLLVQSGCDEEKIITPDRPVSDPWGGDREIYSVCLRELTRLCRRLISLLLAREAGVILSELVREDAATVSALERLCFSSPWSEDGVLGELDTGCSVFIKAMSGNTLAGYVSCRCAAGTGYINNLAVTPGLRRHGTARALMIMLESRAADREVNNLTLEVRPSNLPAVGLYTSLGYERAGCRRDFYSDPREDGLILTKDLERLV